MFIHAQPVDEDSPQIKAYSVPDWVLFIGTVPPVTNTVSKHKQKWRNLKHKTSNGRRETSAFYSTSLEPIKGKRYTEARCTCVSAVPVGTRWLNGGEGGRLTWAADQTSSWENWPPFPHPWSLPPPSYHTQTRTRFSSSKRLLHHLSTPHYHQHHLRNIASCYFNQY